MSSLFETLFQEVCCLLFSCDTVESSVVGIYFKVVTFVGCRTSVGRLHMPSRGRGPSIDPCGVPNLTHSGGDFMDCIDCQLSVRKSCTRLMRLVFMLKWAMLSSGKNLYYLVVVQ